METDFFDEFRDKISDQDWKRVHYLGHCPMADFLALCMLAAYIFI